MAYMGLAVAGAITSAVGTYAQMRNQKSTTELNAALTKAGERITQAQFKFEIEGIEREKESFVGTQVSKAAKSGFMFSGSVSAVVQDTIKNFNRDILATKISASISQMYSDQTYRVAKQQARYLGRMALPSAFMTGASQFTSYMMQQQGGT